MPEPLGKMSMTCTLKQYMYGNKYKQTITISRKAPVK